MEEIIQQLLENRIMNLDLKLRNFFSLDKGTFTRLFDAIAQNKSLRSLDLGSNWIGTVDLAGNRLGLDLGDLDKEHFERFCLALERNQTLTFLGLGGNRLGDLDKERFERFCLVLERNQ